MVEPKHIKEILPSVMQTIKNRCNRFRREHRMPLLGDRKSRQQTARGNGESSKCEIVILNYRAR